MENEWISELTDLNLVQKELSILIEQLDEANVELEMLQSQLNDAENELKMLQSQLNDDEILDLKFKIKKLNKEGIPNVQNQIQDLIKKEEDLNAKLKPLQEEIYRKDKLFKKLYVEFDDKFLLKLCNNFSLENDSIEDNLKILVDKYSETKINNAILKEILIEDLDDNDLSLFSKKYSISPSRVYDYLIERFSLNQINNIKNQLYQEKRIDRVHIILSESEIEQLQKDFSLDDEDFLEMLSEMDVDQLYSLKTWLKRKYPNGYW